MAAGLWFWLIYVICVLFGVWVDWPADRNYRPLGGKLVLFVLLGLLGWAVFGAPLK